MGALARRSFSEKSVARIEKVVAIKKIATTCTELAKFDSWPNLLARVPDRNQISYHLQHVL